jgi:hypothetical protein
MIWSTRVLGENAAIDNDPIAALTDDASTGWPVHEVGRNADFFDLKSARLLKAGSSIVSDSVHLHSNGRDTKAHLEIGFKFAPKGFVPEYKRTTIALGNGVDIDIRPMENNQQLHAYAVMTENVKVLSFEPHLHAPGMRMCLEAIWGYNIQTINCVGYDHNWVRGYHYTENSAPLIPKGDPPHHRLHGQHPGQQEHPRPAQLAGLGQPVGREHVHRPRQPRRADRRSVQRGDGQAP